LAHDKAPVINYLPLIPFHDHFLFEGGIALMARECRSAATFVTTRAKELNIDKLIDGGVDVSEALAVAERQVDPEVWISAKVRTRIAQLKDAVAQHKALFELATQQCITPQQLASHVSDKTLCKVKSDIARNTVVDLHFLPPCGTLFDEAMLVQLRCVASTPREVMEAAMRSWSNEQWERSRAHLPAHLAAEMITAPTRLARLRSPYLEALMARFGSLFARVGTRDIPEALLVAMTEHRRTE